MENDSVKICCASGKPKEDSYVGIGKEINLSPDLKIYQVGNGNKKGIILIYDIFGFDICQTRRFADSLAEHSMNVVMPDFFRGKPWKLENFPPKNFDDLIKFINKEGSYSIVEKDLVHVQDHLKNTGVSGKSAVLGFCWGGKMVVQACSTNLYSCGVSIHGAQMTADLVKDVTVPIMFLPAGDDPSLDSVEEVLHTKSFGKDCVYHRFDDMIHGFAAARGNWNDDKTREAILKAISMSVNFVNKHIN